MIAESTGLRFIYTSRTRKSCQEPFSCDSGQNRFLTLFRKGRDFRTITWANLRRFETLMNNRPRKCLGYRTPAEVFLELSP